MTLALRSQILSCFNRISKTMKRYLSYHSFETAKQKLLINQEMRKIINRLDWICDYYIVFLLYNPYKIDRYHKYLSDKWDFGTNKESECEADE